MRIQPNSLEAPDRRSFLKGASVLAGSPLLGLPSLPSAAPHPEVRSIRLVHFSEVYFLHQSNPVAAHGNRHEDFYELFAKPEISGIRELTGRSVSISAYGAAEHVLMAGIAAYVGMDPVKDIRWLVGGNIDEASRAFVEGRADAYLAVSSEPPGFRARGKSWLRPLNDRPRSQFFCCMLTGNRQFVSRYPLITHRADRAFYNAAPICATQPQRAARLLADRGFTPSNSTTLEVLRELPFDRRRGVHPEDTIRFHALRLYEGVIVKSNPRKLSDRGTDWRFLNELSKLKA